MRTPTVDELLAAIQAATTEEEQPNDEEALRANEWAKVWDCEIKKARRLIREALEAGVMIRTKKRMIKTDGVELTVTAYRYLTEEERADEANGRDVRREGS